MTHEKMMALLLLLVQGTRGLQIDYNVKTDNMKHFYSVSVRLQEQWGAMANLENWPSAFVEMSECVEAAPSALHGRGLFASAPISKGQVVTFYPVDAMGDSLNALALNQYESLGSRDYKGELFHGLLQGWAEDLWIDANPSKLLVRGWLGHLVNDAAVCASSDQHDIDTYYSEVADKANCELVPFGDACPLMAIVATRDLEAGAELLQPYDHDYWTQGGGGLHPEDVQDEARVHFDRKIACKRAIEETYGPEIQSLSDLLVQQLPHKLVDVDVPVQAAGGAARINRRRRRRRRDGPKSRRRRPPCEGLAAARRAPAAGARQRRSGSPIQR